MCVYLCRAKGEVPFGAMRDWRECKHARVDDRFMRMVPRATASALHGRDTTAKERERREINPREPLFDSVGRAVRVAARFPQMSALFHDDCILRDQQPGISYFIYSCQRVPFSENGRRRRCKPAGHVHSKFGVIALTRRQTEKQRHQTRQK